MRLRLRLIATVTIAAGLVGIALALTVLNTREGSDDSPPEGSPGSTGKSLTGATGPTGGGDTLDYAQAIPLPIDGPLLGVNLTAYTHEGYSQPSVRQAMSSIADLGSTAVTLVPTWYMKSADANSIAPDRDKSPSDESLLQAIKWAREVGLQVVIKPHVDVLDDTYRGEIQPTDRDKWFTSYQRFIDHYADLSAAQSANLFVVGTELKTVSGETERWRVVIRHARDRFRGPMTYAANWDEVDQVQFWDELDAIGVDAYYPLSPDDGSRPTLISLVREWRKVALQLRDKSEQLERPVLLTEVGYPSQVGATAKPFEVTDKPADQNVQALAYRATFEALSGSEWLKGISWWSWRADPSSDENLAIDYTPEGKKARRDLARGQWGFEG